jgi:hypothetical protein
MSQQFLVGDIVQVEGGTGAVEGINGNLASVRIGSVMRGGYLDRLNLITAVDPQTEANAYLEEHVDRTPLAPKSAAVVTSDSGPSPPLKIGGAKVMPLNGLDIVYADLPAGTSWRHVLIAGAKNRPPSKVT